MKLFLRYWRFLAHTMGEGDYDRCLDRLRRKHPGQAAATPREFYLKRLQKRYSRSNRCC